MKLFPVAYLISGLMALICLSCQPLISERLSAKPEYLALTMSTESISQIIASNKPLLNIAISSTKLTRLSIGQTSSPSYSVFMTAIDAFTNCDAMLRMIIDKKRLESLKGNNYVEIKFRNPVNLNIATGGTLSVSSIVIPLAEEQTTPAWNFYYSQDSRNWFALRWTNPNPATLTQLNQQIQALI